MNPASPRTDLAAEWAGPLPSSQAESVSGLSYTQRQRHGVPVGMVEIRSSGAAKRLGRPKGRYITLEPAAFSSPVRDLEAEAMALAEELRALLPKEGPVLVVGLGNRDITPDALGPAVTEGVFVTRHLQGLSELQLGRLRNVSAIAPGVLGQTGIESAELAAAAAAVVKPSAMVVVDALAAAEPARLGKTVQLSDTGIIPGSGVANHRTGLCQDTLGMPVIAAGIPTVTELALESGTALVTPREIDSIIRAAAQLLALGINLALQQDISPEEMRSLMSD